MTIHTHVKNNQMDHQVKNDQYFTFILDSEEYGIDIHNVLEIRGLERMTAIPGAPSFVKGVINLRGSIIPAMDLRERFGINAKPYTQSTVLIILQINTSEHKRDIGIIVDAISDVYDIDPLEIQPKPEICNKAGHEYIAGLVTVHQKDQDDKLIILLDVTKLLTADDLKQISGI